MDLLGQLRGNPAVVYGYNGALTTTFELVADGSVAFAENAGATELELASTSADDKGTAPAGTGAQEVRVMGLREDGAFVEERLLLNGQTEISTQTKFLPPSVHLEVVAVGVGGVNAGVISVAKATANWTAGVPDAGLINSIPVGEAMSHAAVFQVPTNEKFAYRLSRLIILARTQPVEVALLSKPAGGLWRLHKRYPVGIGGVVISGNGLPCLFYPGELLRFDALSTTAGGVASVEAHLERVVP